MGCGLEYLENSSVKFSSEDDNSEFVMPPNNSIDSSHEEEEEKLQPRIRRLRKLRKQQEEAKRQPPRNTSGNINNLLVPRKYNKISAQTGPGYRINSINSGSNNIMLPEIERILANSNLLFERIMQVESICLFY